MTSWIETTGILFCLFGGSASSEKESSVGDWGVPSL
jgi:hypothetical protein